MTSWFLLTLNANPEEVFSIVHGYDHHLAAVRKRCGW